MIPTENGITTILGNRTVDETVLRLKALLQDRGIELFALIDHSGEAEKVGMQMRPTKVLIFGNPKGGTPLMLASPTLAIDLPLKIMVWEGDDGKTRLSYNTPAYLQSRHNLPANLTQSLAVVATLASKSAE